MKTKRKKGLVIGLSTLVVVASIAIPVGIVYGGRGSSSSSTSYPSIVSITKQDALPNAYTFGTDPKAISVPELAPDGYSFVASDYQPGTTEGPIVTNSTVAGQKATTVTFTYRPKEGKSGPTYKITYPLNTVKGVSTGFGVNNSGKDEEFKDVTYGTASFAQVDRLLNGGLDLWLNSKKYNGYYLKAPATGAPNPRYLKKDGISEISSAEMSMLDATETFTGVYKFAFNSEQFTAPGSTVPVAEGVLTATFTIVPLALLSPPALIEALDVPALEYGTTGFVFPTPGDEAKREHYAQIANSRVSSIVTRPAGATATPAEKSPVEEAKVMDYEPGTVFTVSFRYEPESKNYTGGSYVYQYTYRVVEKSLATPVVPTYPLVKVEYGKSPTAAPLTAPTSFANFTGTFGSAVVSKKSDVAGTAAKLSPQTGEQVDWTKVNSYNAGTHYRVVFNYLPNKNFVYDGTPVMTVQEYEIVKQKVTFDEYDLRDVDTTSYAYGSDPAALNQPMVAPGLILSPNPVYYAGELKPAPNDNPLTAELVKRLAADASFISEWTATLDTDNYEPSAANAPGTYKIAVPYKVGKQKATYDSQVLSYVGAEMTYQQALPAGFIPDSPALPQPEKNNGYEYKGVSYKITTPATDGTGPAKDMTVTDLSMVSSYGAGTVVTATFTFMPSANYSGNPVLITKTLAVQRKAITPAPASSTATATTVVWGTPQKAPNIAPTAPEGYKVGTYQSAAFKTLYRDGKQVSASETVDWNSFTGYGADTVITITWIYLPDAANYVSSSGAELAAVVKSQDLKILRAPTTKPVGLDQPEPNVYRPKDKIVYTPAQTTGANQVYAFPTADNAPVLGTGYGKPTLKSVLVSSDNGTNTPAVGQPVADWDQANKFEAGSEFEAVYEFVADFNHDGDTFQYIVTYRSGATPATKPIGLDESPVGTLRPKAKTAYNVGSVPNIDFPATASAPSLGTGYKGVLSSVLVRLDNGTSTPDVDQNVTSWTQAKDFDVGSEFEATYTYAPDTGFSGDTFTYVVTYVATANQAIKPTGLNEGPAGTYRPAASVSYSPDSPPVEPSVPVLGTGYVGQLASRKVSKDGGAKTPSVNDPLTSWQQAASFDTGSEFEDTYAYSTAKGYVGDPFTYVVTYVITTRKAVKPTVDVTESPVGTIRPVNKTNYGPDAPPPEPTTANAPVLGTGYIGTLLSKKISYDNGVNTPSNGDEVTDWNAPKNYEFGSEIEVTYNYVADTTNGYVGDSFSYIVTYRIGTKAATKPTVGVVESPAGTIRPTSSTVYYPDAPPPAATSANVPALGVGYMGVLDAIAVSKAPAGATKTPAAGTLLNDWNEAKGYDNGAEFTATYTYTPDAANGYTGDAFQYVVTYAVTYRNAVMPTQAQINAAMVRKNVFFNTFDLANPFPAPPFAGYKATITSSVIAVKSSFPETAPYLSPAIGTAVNAPYTNLPFYNTETVIRVTYQYTGADGYAATPFTATKDYLVITASLGSQFPELTLHTGAPITFSKTANNVSELIPTYDPKFTYWFKAGSVWNRGPSAPGNTYAGWFTNIDDIINQPEGTVVTIAYRFWFAPATNKHNYLGQRASGTYYETYVIEKTFIIAP